MNRYLLDTNVISEIRKPKPHGAVVAWIEELREEQMFLSAVTIGELQAGIERARIQDEAKARDIEAWLERVAQSYALLPMDAACFRECARLMQGKSDDLFEDAMIAATAQVHNLIVATRNENDFRHLRVQVFNPFKFSAA